MVTILYRKELVLVKVLYYRPDYTHLLNDFTWQTEDYVPDIPRIHAFLNYWKNNIHATIKTVEVTTSARPGFRQSVYYREHK